MEDGLYNFTANQPSDQNYAMVFLSQHDLPIRVVYKSKEKLYTYRGLWICTNYSYGLTSFSNGFKVYCFTLKPYHKK